MSEQTLKDQVLAKQAEFNQAIAAARDAGVAVNLWIQGTGPTHTGPSTVALDFGNP
jgi:hypothetical protein